MTTENTLHDLCVVMERIRKENPSVGKLAFTLPHVGRVELTFLREDADDPKESVK